MVMVPTERVSHAAALRMVGEVVLVVGLSFLLGCSRDSTASNARSTASDSAVAVALPPAVATFIRFTEEKTGNDGASNHAYTADGLRLLADALAAVPGGSDAGAQVTGMRAHADSMQDNAAATSHARHAREAALMESEMLGQLQADGRPWLVARIGQVNEAAMAIKSDRPLLDQMAAVQAFFEQSANAVREMSKGK